MNGRVYDPITARFLSPDIVVQAPLNTQNYNRYTYCLNNPLKYTDPTGYYMSPCQEWEQKVNDYYNPETYDPTTDGGFISDHMENSRSDYAPIETQDGYWAPDVLTTKYLDDDGNWVVSGTELLGWEWIDKPVLEINNDNSYTKQINNNPQTELTVMPNWNDLNDRQKIERILNTIHNGGLYFDINKIFNGFPEDCSSQNCGIDLFAKIPIGDNLIPVYMNIAIYNDMRFKNAPQYGQTGPINSYVKGYHRTGNWLKIDYGAYRGTEDSYPIRVIQIQAPISESRPLTGYIRPIL